MATHCPRHIFEAVANDDEEAVKNFVEKRYVSLKNHDSLDQSVAHVAVKRANISILKYLLNTDAYLLTAKDRNNFTIFHLAAEKGLLPVVKCLMGEYKMDPYEPVEGIYRNTALHVAAQGGALDIVKYFIEEKRMDANLKNAFQRSPVFTAALNLQSEVIRYLIERQNVDVAEVDLRNDNILFPIVKKKGLDLIKYLLDDRLLNFDINWRGYSGKTLLHWAAGLRQTNLLSYFVEQKNADVNIADEDGWIPLHVAVDVGNLKTVQYLVEHKGNFRLTNKEGKMPVELCRGFHTKNYLDGIASCRGRPKRMSRSAFESVPFAEPVPLPLTVPALVVGEKQTQNRQLSTSSSADLFEGIDHAGLDIILVFVSWILDILGRRRQRKHSSSPHHEIAQSRIDRAAIAAVYAYVDFEN